MPQIIWSRRSLADLRRLRLFLSSKDGEAAVRAVARIRKGVQFLHRRPEAGRPVLDAPGELREWPMRFGSGRYIALYRLEREEVTILAIRHSREAGY
jgi:plasmid stabilization system protein ParE